MTTQSDQPQTDFCLPMIRHLQGAGMPSAERGCAVMRGYPTARQQEFAGAMIERHPRAIDYLEQAPILLLPVSMFRRRKMRLTSREPNGGATPPLNGATYEAALNEWRDVVCMGWKLPKVLAHYRLAPQLRAIKAGACNTSNLWPLSLISDAGVDGARLAGAIPKVLTHQRVWLNSVRAWQRQLLRRRVADQWEPGLRWATLAFARGPHDPDNATFAEDLYDFSAVAGAGFNDRMTLAEALNECAAWHTRDEAAAALGFSMNELDFVRCHKVQPDWEVPIHPFPARWSSGAWEVIALTTGRALWEEHVAMSHCVDTYFTDVILGDSRIYSVRHNGHRKATLEYRSGYVFKFDVKLDGTKAEAVGIETETLADGSRIQLKAWRFSQYKTRGNHKPAQDAWDAKALFERALESAGVRFMNPAERLQNSLDAAGLPALVTYQNVGVVARGDERRHQNDQYIIDDPSAPDDQQ